MTDEDVIKKCHRIAGCGSFLGPYKTKNYRTGGFHKDSWKWQSSEGYASYALAIAMLPWFGSRRREKIVTILTEWLAWKRTNPKPGAKKGKVTNAKLTPEMIEEIRSKYPFKRGEQTNLAKKFGVHASAVSRAAKGQTWT